jgi:hypothetical protein
MTEEDPDRMASYLLRWPASMADQVIRAAKARTMPLAVWLREAAREKLERDGES